MIVGEMCMVARDGSFLADVGLQLCSDWVDLLGGLFVDLDFCHLTRPEQHVLPRTVVHEPVPCAELLRPGDITSVVVDSAFLIAIVALVGVSLIEPEVTHYLVLPLPPPVVITLLNGYGRQEETSSRQVGNEALHKLSGALEVLRGRAVL